MYKFIKVTPFPHPSDAIYYIKRELSSAYFPSSLTRCFIIYQMSVSCTKPKNKRREIYFFFFFSLLSPIKKKGTNRGRGGERGIDVRGGEREGEGGKRRERRSRGWGRVRACTRTEAPRRSWWITEVKVSGWHYVNYQDSQAMRWWLQRMWAMLCSPDARVPCYFFSLQLPLGWILPDPGPWEKKKILQEIPSPSPTHIAQLPQQERKKKKRRGRGKDVTCLSTGPAPPWTPPDVFEMPFV